MGGQCPPPSASSLMHILGKASPPPSTSPLAKPPGDLPTIRVARLGVPRPCRRPLPGSSSPRRNALLASGVRPEIISAVYLKRKRIGNPSLNCLFRHINTHRQGQAAQGTASDRCDAHTRSRTHTVTHSHIRSTHSHTQSHEHTIIQSHTARVSNSQSHTQSHTVTRSYTIPVTDTWSHTHTDTHTVTYTYSHTHVQTRT